MVAIIGDTTSGLPAEVVDKYDIPIIPQIIHFGEDSYLEGLEMDNAAFMARLKSVEELPRTSAPPPKLFMEVFAPPVERGEAVLCILPSSVVSGTVRSATVAAQDFPGADIRVIDTGYIASPVATLLQLASERAAAGASIDKIEQQVRALLPRCRIYFLVDTLKYLAKGGRIGGAAALLGGVLQVKPVLTLQAGQVEPFEKVRTKKRALARLKELVVDQYPQDGAGHLAVMHAAVPDEAEAFAAELVAALSLKQAPFILNVPPAIVVHGGPGVLGVSFFVAPAET